MKKESTECKEIVKDREKESENERENSEIQS